MNKVFFLAAALLLLCPVAAYGQPELIVRLEGEEAAPLLRALQTGAADSAQAALFEGVEERRSVLPESGFARATGRTRRPQPFTAYTLTARDSTAFERLREAWARRPEVRYVQPNYRYEVDGARSFREAPAYDDPYLDSLQHLEVIRAREAWEATTGSEEVRIGFVDTGLFLEHPDLRSQLWINPGEDLNGDGRVDPSDFNGRDDDGNGYVDDLYGYDFVDRPEVAEPGDYAERDPDPSPGAVGTSRGHGTAVAGVLAAALDNGTGGAGVAPGSRLVPLRAFGGDGIGATDDIAAAIVYAADAGLDVINLSFGRDVASPLLRESIQYAVSQGAVVVASAGNSGGGDPHYPSDYPEVISVGWLNEDGTNIFSSPLGAGEYGLGLDLGAPATNVYTTLLPPESDPDAAPERLYGRRSGSSMAAPQVAGAAALLRSLDASLSPAAIRSVLSASAADLRSEGWDRRTASGRLDVAAALGQALPARTEILRPGHDAGVSGPEVAVTGSAIDPSFSSFSVYYARGDTASQERDFDWQRIAGPVEEQALRDTLAFWDVEALSEGTYTLRLAVRLRDGRTVEDRRRVFVDRTPPEVHVRLLTSGLVGGTHGIVADIETDDLTTATLRVTQGGRTFEEKSEHRARRHGLTWADRQGDGGRVQVTLEAVNATGQRTAYEDVVDVPRHRMNSALFTEEELDVRLGRLLPRTSDFDRDGLLEITFNRYVDGTYSDTLATYEWDGSGFARAHTITSDTPFIPRDVGDTNANDLEELLLAQVQGSVLLEQQDPEGYPDQRAPLDTTGLGGSSDMPTQLGRMTDLDADGRLELLGHNREQWRLFEHAADDEVYCEVARLENPTDPSSENVDGNGFEGPEALTGDFDGDGRRELLVGDEDGDWILYEARADDRLEPVWTHETRRYFAGRRFAKGDFDGDGTPQFATYVENWQSAASGGENEPSFGFYYFWESTGDDNYRVTDSLIVSGELSRRGAMTAADFDGDGRDELVIVHPPQLFVLAYDEAEGWEVRYRRDRSREAPGKGLRSASLVTGDFDGDGTPELVAGAADGHMRRFVYQAAAAQEPPPRWVEAVARDAETVALAWRASGADSVTVYRGPPGAPFDALATTADSSLRITATERMRYRLRAWFDGAGSPLSEARTVRPHAPATLAEVSYPDTATAKLVFTEPLASSTRAGQFSLKEGGRSPEALLLAEGDRAAILRFERRPGPGADTLRWRGLHDAGGTPVATTATPVAFPASFDSTLIVSRWSLLGRHTVRLIFSEALDPALASDPENYRLRPIGEVEAVDFEEGEPMRVDVHVGETRLGATGREQSLTVLEMRGQSGAVLAPEGGSIRLSKAAEDLRQVYIYPNPHRQRQHERRVTIAGLPEESEVLILSTQGTLVKTLEEPVVNGGMAWDLTDRGGRRVPSGVYLVRVSAPDEQPVLKKVAVIR